MVGGNCMARVVREQASKNESGVSVRGVPVVVMDVVGWLDRVDGQIDAKAYRSQVEGTTHVFVSDYEAAYAALSEKGLSLVIGGRSYGVLLIEDPMGLHRHVETYLRYVGVT